MQEQVGFETTQQQSVASSQCQQQSNCNNLTVENVARASPWHNTDLDEDLESNLKMDPALRKSIFPGVPPFINYVPIGGVTGEVVR